MQHHGVTRMCMAAQVGCGKQVGRRCVALQAERRVCSHLFRIFVFLVLDFWFVDYPTLGLLG